ncbi:MAG: DNA polymerase III subunit alpha [Holosporaceae bacterium]|jgi:DNA polymerase-3 subunit alpha|nr:DNA polymerase III subunit alpha [Holosporaceae bacterium]
MKKPFVHLRLHSAYSLAEGAIKIDRLVELCEKNRMPAVAVTDTNNLFGAIEISSKCAARGIQPIVACQLNVKHPKKIDRSVCLLLYAKNENGYQNLIQLASASHLASTSPLYPEISLDLLAKHSQDLLLVTGGVSGSLGALLLENDMSGAEEYLRFLLCHFGDRLYVELSRHNNEHENRIEEAAISLAYDLGIPLVATNNVCYPTPEDFDSHDALICIAQGRTLYDSDRQISSPEFYFKSSEEMNLLFADIPEALANTWHIAQRCSFMLRKQKPVLPQFPCDHGRSQDDELLVMATDGLLQKLEKFKNKGSYEAIHHKYMERLEYELTMIKNMGFSGYFLIVSDYVRWAKTQRIPVGPGRGSGAGSIVAWSVQITDIDPIRFNLFFERFLNPDRVTMPDFDVDFCQERRDEVILYAQRKYGQERVAQIITFGKLQARAVVRDIGRVLCMSYGFVDKISKMIPFHPTNPLTLQESIDAEQPLQELINSDPQVQNLMRIALKLEGLYRHAGVHAAGVVIANRNLLDIVPLYMDSRSLMPVTQFSMKYIEDASLIKFDFLGLKTLTVIQKILDLVEKRGQKLVIQDIPLNDVKTFNLLKSVNCVGVFQIESGGMRDVLKRLQPDRVEDLIALVALFRPGPMDDIPKYIACKHGIEPITYLHEKLKPILEETYGVMVYQEQVMQIAQEIGGYSLGQADLLRRAMGKKNKEEMRAQKKRFIDGAVERGIPLTIAQRLFEQMNKFAGYGFNKSHSTPYGLLTYQTAFLKANHMLEFFAALMTLDMTNTEKMYVYYQDAKKNGIGVTPPDINLSESDFLMDYSSNSIRYSLAAIKGVGEHVVKKMVEEREDNGQYSSIFDFVERLLPLKILNRRFMENFVKSGVFDRLHHNRRQLWESLDLILSMRVETEQASLFEKSYPELIDVPEWSNAEKLNHEFDAIGFYISSHPLQPYEKFLKQRGVRPLVEAKEFSRGRIAVVVNNLSYKNTKSNSKFCIVQVSDMSGEAEISVFSDVLMDASTFLQAGNVLIMDVKRQKNGDYVRLTAERMELFDKKSALMVEPFRNESPVIGNQILRIKIGDKNELMAVRNFIDGLPKDGKHSLELTFPDGGEIALADGYFLRLEDIFCIKNIVGDGNVTEIPEHSS